MLTERNPVGYGYTIRATNNFHDVIGSMRAAESEDEEVTNLIGEFGQEHEWVAVGYIPPTQILSVVQITRQPDESITISVPQDNPIYERDNTRASADLLPLRGAAPVDPPRLDTFFTLNQNRNNGSYMGIQYCAPKYPKRQNDEPGDCGNPYEIPVREYIAARGGRFYMY